MTLYFFLFFGGEGERGGEGLFVVVVLAVVVVVDCVVVDISVERSVIYLLRKVLRRDSSLEKAVSVIW